MRIVRMLVGVGLALVGTQALRAQPAVQGRWTTLPYLMPINPVHIVLMNNGKVLVVAGSGNVATETNFRATVWDPQAGTFTTQSVAWDMFCNGAVVLSDGRVLIDGGNLQYDPFRGEPRNSLFNPSTGLFTDIQNMAHGRWYPTVTTLGDGRVMTFSGLNEVNGGTNTAVEIYTLGSGWSQEFPAGWTPPLYPRMHLMTDGNVFYSGSGTGSRIFNTTAKTWSSQPVATTNYANARTYGTSVMLPLTPANGYAQRVMIFGGGNPATATTEIINLSASPLQWQYGPSMSQPRIEMNATILPNGKVLAMGGSLNDEDTATKSLNADLYNPATNAFSSAGTNAFPRLYHSGSLLLPDATVALVGGNPTRGSYEQHIEIYSPAYLFNTDGSAALRPSINAVTPNAFTYGASFQVQTPDAANISSVVLVRPGAQTHAFDMEQRLIGLSYTAGPGVLTVTAPSNGNIAPPGYYMLFILNSSGVPSVAGFVRVSAGNQAPTATITSPATNVTANPGGAVAFAGTGSDPDGTIASYAWTFPGGSPSSSSQANAGNVTYSTPGTYTASFTVTDNGGRASAPATRTITVADFSLSATPSSRTVLPGGSTTYTATVTPINGFSGTVNFGVTGLPSGATASFSPASITSSGSTTLTVATSGTTPPGSYPLTIQGTSGPRTRSVSVTLVVNGDFSISATPASVAVSREGTATYTVTIAAGAGFSGTVALSVSGVPPRATATLDPPSVVNAGTSTLTIATQNNTQKRTSTLTITGTGGGRTHSTTVTLTIQ